MNMKLFTMINNLANKSSILDIIMIILSKGVPFLFVGVVLLVLILMVVKKKKFYMDMAIDTIAITVISLAVSLIISKLFYVDRPFVSHNVNLLVAHAANASFPSDHVIGTMGIAMGINRYEKGLGKVLILLSVLVGISRVFVGNHYPLDVFGGFIVVLVVYFIYTSIVKRNYKVRRFRR